MKKEFLPNHEHIVSNRERYSFYYMHENKYMGDCLTVVYAATEHELSECGLTDPNVVIMIKIGQQDEVFGSDKALDYFDFLSNADIFQPDQEIPIRVASICQLGTLGDSHCNCEEKKVESLQFIGQHGQGVYIQMPQEAMGQGLLYKAKELELQVSGRSPEGDFVGKKSIKEASDYLLDGHPLDIRKYSLLRKILADLGLNRFKYSVMTSTANKAQKLADEIGVKSGGFFRPSDYEITPENAGAILGKVYYEDMQLHLAEINAIMMLLEENLLPERALSILQLIVDKFYQDPTATNLDIDKINGFLENFV
jgi:GTP cyclohydrolase II